MPQTALLSMAVTGLLLIADLHAIAHAAGDSRLPLALLSIADSWTGIPSDEGFATTGA